MADRGWIERVVNTKGRPCPLRLSDACPGAATSCAFWLDEIVRNTETGDADVQGGCAVLWLYVQTNENRLEQQRLLATLDKHATQVHHMATGLRLLVHRLPPGREADETIDALPG